jgi:hypothetical protein
VAWLRGWNAQIQALTGHDDNYQIAVDKVASLTEVRPAVLLLFLRILLQHRVQMHVWLIVLHLEP